MTNRSRPPVHIRAFQLALTGEFWDRADLKRRLAIEYYRPDELAKVDTRWLADALLKTCKKHRLPHVRKGRTCVRPLDELPREEAMRLYQDGIARRAQRLEAAPYIDPGDVLF